MKGDEGRAMDIKEINGDQWRSIENKGVASRSLGSSYLELLLAAQQRAHARSDLELVEQLWGKEGGEGRGRRDEHLHAGRVADLELWQSPVRTSARSSRCARVLRRQSEAITFGNERKIISVPILALPPAMIPFTIVRSGALASGTMPSSADAFEK